MAILTSEVQGDAEMHSELPDLRQALWEVLDSLGALGGKWHELLGFGFTEERAKAICSLLTPGPSTREEE